MPRMERGIRAARGFLATLLLATSLVSLTSLALVTPASSQEPPPEVVDVVVGLDPPAPRLGDRVRLTITVTHPADRLLTVLDGPESSSTFDILETLPAQTEPLEDALVTEFAYILAPFDLGPIELGSVTLSALTEDGVSEQLFVPLPALPIAVTITGADLELRPLKPQLDTIGAPPAWRGAVLGGGIAAALVTLVALLVWRLRRRRETDTELEPLQPATAEDRARRRLDSIGRSGLVAASDFEQYYGRLSLTVRDYIEERFDFRATALTTVELARRAALMGVDRWQGRLVAGLLQRCDAAVYAGRYPDPASADHDLTLAYEIVELARPRREDEPVEAAG